MNIYEKLCKLKEKHPELTYNNNGYAELPKSVRQRNAAAIKEIEAILKESIAGFSRFQNFKPRKDGSWAVRCQYDWSANTTDRTFIGVGYFPIEDFKTL